MTDVVTMKSQRWAQKGVTFEKVLEGERLEQIAADHQAAIEGRINAGISRKKPSKSPK